MTKCIIESWRAFAQELISKLLVPDRSVKRGKGCATRATILVLIRR